MDEKTKATIDAMSYEQLLRRWRNAPAGDPLFQGEAGEYYSKRMAEQRAAVGQADAVRASKRIGWGDGR